MQKPISIVLLFVFFQLTSFAQDGIKFQSTEWEAILQKAAQEDKLVFVDAYTTWCGPCKKMSKEVFTQKEVADFFNKTFVNYKIDMEKGEGPTLAETYQVAQYPTLLFINGKGKLIHRAAGYYDAERLIDLGNDAMNPAQQLAAQEQRFEQGERDAEFLKSYTALRAMSYDGSHGPIAEAYLQAQKNKNTEEVRSFVFEYVDRINSKLFKHLSKYRADYIEQLGEGVVRNRINTLVQEEIADQSTDEDIIGLKAIKKIYKKAYPQKAKEMYSAYKMTHYRSQGDRKGFAKAALKHYKKYPSNNPEELNEVAWTFNSVITQEKYLKKVTKLAKQSIEIEPAFYNHDTLAALYYKLGEKKAAIEAATKAIELAKRDGFDPESYAETVKLLETLKAIN